LCTKWKKYINNIKFLTKQFFFQNSQWTKLPFFFFEILFQYFDKINFNFKDVFTEVLRHICIADESNFDRLLLATRGWASPHLAHLVRQHRAHRRRRIGQHHRALKVSISPTFYAYLFRTKVLCPDFLYL